MQEKINVNCVLTELIVEPKDSRSQLAIVMQVIIVSRVQSYPHLSDLVMLQAGSLIITTIDAQQGTIARTELLIRFPVQPVITRLSSDS